MASPRNQSGSWRVRRRIIHITLVLCALQIGYLTIWGKDTRLAETLALGAYTLAGAVIGSYVFGAVWEDVKIKQSETYSGGYGSPYPLDDRPR